MKKPASKVTHNQPQFFFSVLPTGPKSAQISYSVHKNGSLRNFYIMTLYLCVSLRKQLEDKWIPDLSITIITGLNHHINTDFHKPVYGV